MEGRADSQYRIFTKIGEIEPGGDFTQDSLLDELVH